MFVVVYKFTRGKNLYKFSRAFNLNCGKEEFIGAIFWVSPPSGRIGSLLKSERTTPPPFFPSLHLIRLEKERKEEELSLFRLLFVLMSSIFLSPSPLSEELDRFIYFDDGL